MGSTSILFHSLHVTTVELVTWAWLCKDKMARVCVLLKVHRSELLCGYTMWLLWFCLSILLPFPCVLWFYILCPQIYCWSLPLVEHHTRSVYIRRHAGSGELLTRCSQWTRVFSFWVHMTKALLTGFYGPWRERPWACTDRIFEAPTKGQGLLLCFTSAKYWQLQSGE